MFHGRLALQGTLRQLQEQTGREHLTDMFLDLLQSDHPVKADAHV
jgi:hypothetical protein